MAINVALVMNQKNKGEKRGKICVQIKNVINVKYVENAKKNASATNAIVAKNAKNAALINANASVNKF